MPITPHGDGPLVDLRCSDSERDDLRTRARGLRGVQLDARELTDLELLSIGGFTPLKGFMTTHRLTGSLCTFALEKHLSARTPPRSTRVS